jgi:DNA-3-methyladenine glycosylase II
LVGKCNLNPQINYFEALAETIISQQLSAKAASSIFKRFCQFYNNILVPTAIIETEDGILRGLGISSPKVKYLKDLSLKIESGIVNLGNIHTLSEDEITEELTRVKGIGVWSVHMFLIFSLGKLNVLPVNDLGIRKAIMQNYNLRKLPDEKKIKKIAKEGKWEPYCSIASWYLWRSLDIR